MVALNPKNTNAGNTMKKNREELEELDEVPLEYSDEEIDAILDEEGMLDGDEEEVAEAAKKKNRKKKHLN
jgi:hypothetical protein